METLLGAGRSRPCERRGKYLLLRLEGERTLAMHLRMTGNLLLVDGGEDPPYLRARLRLDGGRRLLFTDARRFGHAVVLDDCELEEYFAARLGVEPLSDSLTAEELCRRAAGRGRRSRASSSTSWAWRGSGTSTRTRRSTGRSFTRFLRRAR